MSGTGGGKSVREMDAERDAWAAQTPCVTSCAFCDWKFTGTAGEGRDAARAHRKATHPHLRARKRRRGSIRSWTRRDEAA